MASPSLSSLLGLSSPSPVIAPSAVEKRLSKIELRVATAAFHRARGYGERIDFPRFRDTVIQEAFHAMPLYAMQRVFMVFNYADGSTGGALTLKEFLVGVAIVWKGTRDEHFKFAFQLMDRHGDQELSKRDAVAFLRAVARADGVVAVEERSGRKYTADEFVGGVLFAGDNAMLTPSKYLKLMTSRSFTYLALVDWIPKLAAQFENEKNKFTAAITPLVKANEPKQQDQLDAMVASIRVKLRRLSLDESTGSTTSSGSSWSPTSPLEQPKQLVEDDHKREFNVIQIETMAAEQFQALKTALWAMIERVLSTRELFTDLDIRQKLEGLIPDTLIQATIRTAEMCAGDFVLSSPEASQNGPRTAVDDITCRSKVRLFWWILCICCSCSRSSAEVFRYLFVLFDKESRGYWTMDQLSTFIQFADFQNEEQSSNGEAAFLAQTVFDEFDATKQQAPQSDRETIDNPVADEAIMFRFRDFDKYLIRYPIPGCSLAELDIIFTLFHVNLARHRGQQLPHRSFHDALSGFCGQLLAHEVSTQNGFCLLPQPSWDRIVDWICDYDSSLPLVSTLKTQVCTTVRVPNASNDGDAINPIEEEDPRAPLVAIPIALWLVVAMRLRERHVKSASPLQSWTKSASKLVFTTADGDSSGNEGPHRGSWTFQGLVTSLDLTVASRDGSECRITMPHYVIDQQLSLQEVVQSALTLHGNGTASTTNGGASTFASHPRGAFYCEGEVVFSNENGSHLQQVSQGVALIPLSTLDEGANSHRLAIKMQVLLTDERSNSSIPRWSAQAMLASPASSYRSNASSPSSRTPRQKRNAAVGWTKVHGLANLGNTCFMNSALQCLAATPLLREYFLKGEHLFDLSTHTQRSKSSSPNETSRKPTKSLEMGLPKSSLLPVAFGQLLAEMNAYSSNGSVSGMSDVISPKHMKTAVASLFPHLSDGSQQDAQEFLSSLLNSLSDELKRLPVSTPLTFVDSSASTTTSTSSLLSRFVNKPERPVSLAQPENLSQSALAKLRFQVNDSEGRPDEIVADEWWVSHLIAEPSIVTALFCGQYKSTLRCTNCGYTSARFEPFSSLQLPLIDETEMMSPRKRPQHQLVTVVLHFLDSPCKVPSLRLVVQAGLDWTVEQLIIKIQQVHATYSNADTRRDHIAVTLNGFVIEDYIDPDALLSTVAAPLNLFEIEFGDQARAFSSAASFGSFEAGEKVLARASHDRWVKGVVERQAETYSSSVTSPVRSLSSAAYNIRITEANCGTTVCLNRSDVRPLTNERLLLLRFVHRRPGLVPFYSTSPYRQVLCGFPFIHRLPTSLLSGRGLYHMIHAKFCTHEMASRRPFVLKRVRSDGKCCGLCHWTDQCDGCKIDRLDEEPLDLEMDETIAIDWTLDAHEPVEDWVVSGYCIEDHTSYVAFKLDNTHSLEKSLDMLCSSEQVEARCSHCPKESEKTDADANSPHETEKKATPSAFVPHTKTLALWSLPPILVIQLKRFELVADRGFTWQRLNHSVDFPVEDFDISKFLAASDAHDPFELHEARDEVAQAAAFLTNELQFPTATPSRAVSSYRLYGIVNHMGDLGGGHYTANIRHPDNADWWLVDDASATPANPQTLSPSSSAYLLFYVRDDLDPTLDDESDNDDHDDSGSSRPTLSEFYPRQTHATRVDDAVIRALCKQDVWQRAASRITDLGGASPSKANSKRQDDGNCAVM